MSQPDENDLRALFAEVDAPAALEDRWQARAALTTPEGEDAAEVVRLPDRERRARSWALAVAAGVAALAAASVVALVVANRLPPSSPDLGVIETMNETPTQKSTAPASTTTPPAAAVGPSQQGQSEQPTAGNTGTEAPAPARGPLAEWPDATNAGVPPGTNLARRAEDLHVTTPGAIVADLQVTGVIYVEAPDVTLRRVRILAPWGTFAGVRQQAPRLRIEDSEVAGPGLQYGVWQDAGGLTVQRSHVHDADYGVGVTTDSLIFDSLLTTSSPEVFSTGGASKVTLRHNTIGAVEVSDEAGAVTALTVEKNRLEFIWAPGRAGSRDIRVTGNHFHRAAGGGPPVSGWNDQAPGNAWTDNVWFGTTEPATP